MSDEQKPSQEGEVKQDDRLANMQAEFNRKLSNTNEQIAALLTELRANKKPVETIPTKKVSVFDDEEAFSRDVEERATARIRAELERKEAAAAKAQGVIQSIVSEYPEVNDDSSALMSRAKEIFGAYSDEYKSSPLAMKAAVTEAASELGVRPRSKRGAGSDNFTVSSSSSSSRQSGGRGELNDKTLEFAQIMGLDVSKKEVRERLTARSKRNFTRYEG